MTRREFVRSVGVASAVPGAFMQNDQSPNAANEVQLSQIHGPSEQDEKAPGPFLPTKRRIGYAIVGLGRLSLDQILPAFAVSQYCTPVALVSGDRTKALKIADQYGIDAAGVYGYDSFERLAENPRVDVVYVVLPNGLHAEYVTRAAKIKKHVLCEKPMAVSSQEARTMIRSCKAAGVKLMIAYRQQYEPHNKALRQSIANGALGKVHGFVSSNSQQQGDPTQWRLNLKLAGGGCLPDVGLYCLNAARFLSGEEPSEVSATIWQPRDDPRFTQVEASCSFTLRFPSGLIASCSTSYDVHESQFLRIEGNQAWAELSPAFAYHSNKLRYSKLQGGMETEIAPQIEEKNQFALEMDHFAKCILEKKEPHTPGEEGLRDHVIMEAIYQAAHSRKSVVLEA